MLSYWTDGLLKSTVHRVVFPEQDQSDHTSKAHDRYSIAFFCQPVSETELIPVPSEIVSLHRKEQISDKEAGRVVGHGGGARGWNSGQPCITAGEHLQSRLAATYV
jgi:isopenicillin N synthase-like dioxygenase